MHTRYLVPSLLLLGSLSLIGAGCGQKPTESTGTTAPTTAPTKPAQASDACGNPYYPFKPGLAIAYHVTPSTGAAGDSDYTIRTVSVAGTTATVRAEMANGAAADMEADCADSSVSLKGSSGLGAAMEGTKFKTTVLSSNGTSMPANVAAGNTWNSSETVKMELTGSPIAGMDTIVMTTKENSRAIGQESVTVPAGTYDAIKIEVTRTTTSTFSGAPAGVKLPEMPPSTSKSTEWWVKGIGMLKSVTLNEGKTSTIEATSVTGQ